MKERIADYFIEFKVKGKGDLDHYSPPMTEQEAEEFLWDLPQRQVAGEEEALQIASAKKVHSPMMRVLWDDLGGQRDERE